MKRLFAAYPGIFFLVALAFVIDLVMIASTGALWRDSSFALGSSGAVIFILGPAILLRFVVFRNRIHLAISWVFIIVLWVGWFAIKALTQSPQYASFLLIMCLVAAFKTMRLEQSDEEKNATEHSSTDALDETKGNEVEPLEQAKNEETPADLQTHINPLEKSTEPLSVSAVPATSSTGGDTSENQNSLRSLKQVLAIMAAIGCLIALWDMPDDYYKVLRFIVVAACGAIIWDIQKSTLRDPSKTWFTVGLGMLAVIFNPILPINLDGDIWRWVNIFGASVFILVEAGKSAAIFLAIIATVILITIDYAKEQKQIAYEKAFNENMQRIRDEENKKKAEEQEKREKQWAEWEAERLKREQIKEERQKLEYAEREAQRVKNEQIEKERQEQLEKKRQEQLEAKRKQAEIEDQKLWDRIDAINAKYQKEKEFTIIGQVKNPGLYKYYRYARLEIFKAIEMAGGWSRNANRKQIRVKRVLDGATKTIIVDTSKIDNSPLGGFDILSGDIIEVSKK